MDFYLKTGLVGVPAHLWLINTAQEILGSSYTVISDLLQLEKVMVAPIPVDRPNVQPCLCVRLCNILEVTDLCLADGLFLVMGEMGHVDLRPRAVGGLSLWPCR